METVGDIMRNRRQEKSLTIREVSELTHINGRFITALENNDFDIIPGDTYIIGFIRNISKVLELDPQEMINVYNNQKSFEEDVPQELIKPPPKKINWKLFLAFGSAIIVVVFLYLIFGTDLFSGILESGSDNQLQIIQLTDEEQIEKVFGNSSTISFNYKEENITIKIVSLNIDEIVFSVSTQNFPQEEVYHLEWEVPTTVVVPGENQDIFYIAAQINTKNQPVLMLREKEFIIATSMEPEEISVNIKAIGQSNITFISDQSEPVSMELTESSEYALSADKKLQLIASNLENLEVTFQGTLIHPFHSATRIENFLGNPGGVTNCFFEYDEEKNIYTAEVRDR